MQLQKRSNSLILQFKTHILMKFIYLHIFCFWQQRCMNIHIEYYLSILIQILLAAILNNEIAKPVAMVGGIGAALVILLVVVAGGILYRYICVSCSFWGIFYMNFCQLSQLGVYSTTIFVSCSWMYFLKVYIFSFDTLGICYFLAAGVSST